MKRLTTASHLNGTDRTGWASVAALLKRAQAHDKQLHEVWSWNDYPINRYGWVTDTGRFLGVGWCADSMLRKGESICRVTLPFKGSGSSLRDLVHKTVKKKGKISNFKAA